MTIGSMAEIFDFSIRTMKESEMFRISAIQILSNLFTANPGFKLDRLSEAMPLVASFMSR